MWTLAIVPSSLEYPVPTMVFPKAYSKEYWFGFVVSIHLFNNNLLSTLCVFHVGTDPGFVGPEAYNNHEGSL